MANTSCNEAASELLRQCIAGERWDAGLLAYLVDRECPDALFRILAEGLADRFEPRLCNDYASIFSEAIERVLPQFRAGDLYARYTQIREPRVCGIEADRVIVLSRVTLGADIAITSVILDAVKKRFPEAEVQLAGNAKAAELFSGDSRVGHLDVPYPRDGSIRDRLAIWKDLAERAAGERTIVVDPDSRLTQLGLLPVCDESRYFFFESRAFGGEGGESLGELARRWASFTFETPRPEARIAPPSETLAIGRPFVAVSLGTGGNDAKRLPGAWEAALIQLLCARFAGVVVDRGIGAEESGRVVRAIEGTSAQAWMGSFARFSSLIAASDYYVGYDSAGQHAAAVFGTPLLTLFKGFVSDRMFARWQPTGPGPKQIFKIADTIAIQEIAAAIKTA